MSSNWNQSDLNEYIRQIIRERQQQAQGAAPPQQPENQGTACSASAGEFDTLASLVAQYLKAYTQGSTVPSLAPDRRTSLLPFNNPTTTAPTVVAPVNVYGQQQQQQSLDAARLLAGFNLNLPTTQNSVAPGQQAQIQTLPNQQGNLLATLMPRSSSEKPSLMQCEDPKRNSGTPIEPKISTSHSSVQNKVADMPKKDTGQGGGRPPIEPVSLAKLQSWDLKKLEAYAKQLEDNNQPIPNAVNIVLQNMKQKEEKRQVKLVANRKAASCSRARKIKLVEELKEANATLRYQVSVLSYMPDSVAALDTDGKIQFASVQLEKMLQYNSDELVGISIEDILAPESKGAIHRLIQDLVLAEQEAEGGKGEERKESDGNGGKDYSEKSSGGESVIPRSSSRYFPLLEVNVNSEDEADDGKDLSDSSGIVTSKKLASSRMLVSALKHTPSSLTEPSEPIAIEIERKPSPQEFGSSNDSSVSTGLDNAMGVPVMANTAKLSSLRYYTKKEHKEETVGGKLEGSGIQRQLMKASDAVSALAREQYSKSLSGTESDEGPGAGVNSSDDSQNRDSNESSEGYFEDSSSLSGNSSWKKGLRSSPLAPSCTVQLIRKDQSTLVCELTSSIRTRNLNDEDERLGVIDLNPKHRTKAGKEQDVAKELLLCLRPILFESDKTGDQMPQQMSESSNANESEESTQNRVKSGSDGNEASDFGKDVTLGKRQIQSTRDKKIKRPHPPKKHSLEFEEGTGSNGKKLRSEHKTKLQARFN